MIIIKHSAVGKQLETIPLVKIILMIVTIVVILLADPNKYALIGLNIFKNFPPLTFCSIALPEVSKLCFTSFNLGYNPLDSSVFVSD